MHLAASSLLLAIAAGAIWAGRRRMGTAGSAAALYAAVLLWLRFGFSPPTPTSLLLLYGSVTTVAFAVYLTSSEAALRASWAPVRRVLIAPELRRVRLVLGPIIGGVVAWIVHGALTPDLLPPPAVRNAHPAPPGVLELRTTDHQEHPLVLDVVRATNPSRGRSADDPERRAAVERGRTVYYENCFFCHGDTLAGDGHYAAAMSPPPADFTAVSVLPMFVDGFFFWRIAKGGPGLPTEGTPFDSSMPAWERFLSEGDVWSVLTYLSDRTGLEPRKREVWPGHEAP